jgi:hypothetical protein
MNEEFLAIVKLTSGEEVLTIVCAFDEEDRTLLALNNPIIMKDIDTPLGPVVKIEPWIKYSGESLYFIDMDKVMTMIEVKDSKIIKLYNQYLYEIDSQRNKKALPNKSMGYISKLEDFRKSLEKIFKS